MHKRMMIVIATLALFMAAFAQNARAHDEQAVPVKQHVVMR